MLDAQISGSATAAGTFPPESLKLRRVASGHIPALDGLRGVAILLVMLYHFTGTYIRSLSGVWYKVSSVGWCGVDLFFVLSGFLITGILCDAKNGDRYFQNFYMRRVLRIFPLYYGFLLIFFVFVPLEHRFSPFIQHHLHEQVWLWCYLTNFDCAHFSRFMDQLRLAHFWSLAIEEQFYLIWPAVIFFSPPRTAMRACALCIGAALLLRLMLFADHANPNTIFNLTPCRMDSLAAGALCALLIRTDFGAVNIRKIGRFLAIFSGLGLAAILSRHGGSTWNNPWMLSLGYSLFTFFFAGMILLSLETAEKNVLTWLLQCPILMLFGFYSYAIYVFHYPLMRFFDRWFPVRTLSADVHSKPLGLAIHVVCSMLVSLLIAGLSWQFYERHFLKLKRYFVLARGREVSGQGDEEKMAPPRMRSGIRPIVREFGTWVSQRPF
jgi:peptidoglycan/LPS O-acetylase OafA/YrhL